MTATDLAADLTARLDAVGAALPPTGGRLRVGTDDALRPTVCPAFGFAPGGEFRWSTVNARRIIGLGVLARLADPPPRPDEDLPDLVAATFDTVLRSTRPEEGSIEAWLAGLDAVAVATLRRSVVTWATGAAPHLLPPGPTGRIVLRGARTWEPRRGRFRLRAHLDVEAPDGDAVVTRGRIGAPGEARTVAACAALLSRLADRGPARVRVVVPDAAHVDVFTVDDALLAQGVDAFVTAAGTAVVAQDGDERLPRVPGVHCWACPRRATCAPGGDWLGGRRNGGGARG